MATSGRKEINRKQTFFFFFFSVYCKLHSLVQRSCKASPLGYFHGFFHERSLNCNSLDQSRQISFWVATFNSPHSPEQFGVHLQLPDAWVHEHLYRKAFQIGLSSRHNPYPSATTVLQLLSGRPLQQHGKHFFASVLVIYCCVTNYATIQWLETATILLYFRNFYTRNSGRVQLGTSSAPCGIGGSQSVIFSQKTDWCAMPKT